MATMTIKRLHELLENNADKDVLAWVRGLSRLQDRSPGNGNTQKKTASISMGEACTNQPPTSS